MKYQFLLILFCHHMAYFVRKSMSIYCLVTFPWSNIPQIVNWKTSKSVSPSAIRHAQAVIDGWRKLKTVYLFSIYLSIYSLSAHCKHYLQINFGNFSPAAVFCSSSPLHHNVTIQCYWECPRFDRNVSCGQLAHNVIKFN